MHSACTCSLILIRYWYRSILYLVLCHCYYIYRFVIIVGQSFHFISALLGTVFAFKVRISINYVFELFFFRSYISSVLLIFFILRLFRICIIFLSVVLNLIIFIFINNSGSYFWLLYLPNLCCFKRLYDFTYGIRRLIHICFSFFPFYFCLLFIYPLFFLLFG